MFFNMAIMKSYENVLKFHDYYKREIRHRRNEMINV